MVRYDERLWVPVVWWIVAAALVFTLWVAYFAAAGAGWAALVSAIVGGIVAGVFIGYGSARVAVGHGELIAGRARIPVSAVGAVEPLPAHAARALRGPRADPRAYLLIRPYLSAAVRVDVDDPADPTPYWYVATRHPEELAAALRAELAGLTA